MAVEDAKRAKRPALEPKATASLAPTSTPGVARRPQPGGNSLAALEGEGAPRDGSPTDRSERAVTDLDTPAALAVLQSEHGAERGAYLAAELADVHAARESARVAELEADADRRVGRGTASNARIRTDGAAAAAASAFGTKAITLGDEILFASGAYTPNTPEGDRLLAHELAHVEQFSAGKVPRGVVPRWPMFRSAPDPDRASPDPDRAADAPPLPARSPQVGDVAPEPPPPLKPLFDIWDPATFWVPTGTARAEIARYLYGDERHVGGFEMISDSHVRMLKFDGALDATTKPMRAALDAELARDVENLVSKVSERRIDSDDERYMINIMTWWANRGDLTDATGRGYFDVLIDRLDHRELTEWGLLSDTTRNATDWIMIEVEEKQDVLIQLIARRSSRGPARHPRGGDRIPEYDRVTGQIPIKAWKTVVGQYAFKQPAPRMALYSTVYGYGVINVTEQLPIDESTATRAEIALRNSAHRGPRVMIPGGDGHFYGYAIAFPFFETDYRPGDITLLSYWWQYPGTVFVPGGEYRPEFGAGGTDERAQRADILARALANPFNEAIRGLDFDVLSLATLDQRYTMIERALHTHTGDDASLIARILYATPVAEFPVLERKMSIQCLMGTLMNSAFPEGALAGIGRVFTIRAMQSMRVPGEGQETLPEFVVGFDSDGYYRYAYPRWPTQVASRALAGPDFKAGDTVSLGHEQALPGQPTAPMQRTAVTIQPAIFRGGNFAGNVVRGLKGTLVDDYGNAIGPLLPTQLVRVKTLDLVPSERVVTVVEALGILEMPRSDMLKKLVSEHIRGGMWILAGMQLAKAFGPAFVEGLTEAGGARAVVGALGRAAATEVGKSAISNAVLLGAMDLVESQRSVLELTPMGRTFLELFDTAMLVWIAHDMGRLIATGIVPRLVKSMDWAMTQAVALRDGLMSVREELEAIRRAIGRFHTPAEAAEAATIVGPTAAAPVEARPGFFAVLRVTRGEVAAERLATQTAGTAVSGASKRVLGRLGSAVERAEAAAATASEVERAGAEAAVESASRARLAVAQRASQLQRTAREQFLLAVDKAMATRPGSLASLTDLLTAAAKSRQPNVFIGEVQKLLDRGRVISDEAIAQLGKKVLAGPDVLDLAWLNGTTISDSTLDFLGRDKRTPWDLYRRAATDPSADGVMRAFRTSARGAGAEMVAESEAARLGTGVRRQVPMGSSEIDFDLIVAGKRRGFEVKGWTIKTWREALEAAVQRLRRDAPALTAEQKEAVSKVDHMLKQLRDIQSSTGKPPILGFTDALPEDLRGDLRRVLERSKVPDVQFVPLSEAQIKEKAQGAIGEAVGVPRAATP
jgi:hypothetical protein